MILSELVSPSRAAPSAHDDPHLLGRLGLICVVMAVAPAVAAGVSVLLTLSPPRIGYAVAALVVCCLVFCLLPWSVLPTGIIGGAVAAGLSGDVEVRTAVAIHAALIGAGVVALLGRRLLGRDRDHGSLERYAPILVLVAVVAVGALYGLARGNAAAEVLTGAYLIGVIPAYFLLAGRTLNTPRRRRAAFWLYTVAVCALTLAAFNRPGQHGSLLTLLPIPMLIMIIGRHPGPRRLLACGAAALLTADLVLASYRGVWIAAAVALMIMLVRGDRTVRRGLLIYAGSVATLAGLLLAGGVPARTAAVSDALARTAGYRLPEALTGLTVFAGHPLLGAGLGQQTHQVNLPGFAVTDVGPAYHAFYVVVLANLGLVGLVAVLVPLLHSAWIGLSRRSGGALPWAALTVGFLVAAVVAGPTDGHWELGLLPALTFLCSKRALRQAQGTEGTAQGTEAQGTEAQGTEGTARGTEEVGP